jgi:hypothetical protein
MIEDLKDRTEREADVRELQALGVPVTKATRAKLAVLVRVHHNNIDRYLRLLRTKLTASERQFVERRLSDEQRAVDKLIFGSFSAAPAIATDGYLQGSNRAA